MNKKGFTLLKLFVGIFVLLLVTIYPLWTQRSLEWCLGAWKGHPVHVPYGISLVLSLIMNGVSIVFNVIVELLRCVK